VIRTVLDANALVSGFPASTGTLADLLDRWRDGQFQLITSEHILDKIARAWIKPYWQRRFASERVKLVMALLREEAEITPIAVNVQDVATHPEDDVVLATAVSARVDYLATGDKGLLRLENYQDIVILTPRAFLNLREQHER
jgi:uncharacterized protein